MVGCHHRLNGHEFEQTQGDSEQGSLACCSPWGCKESDTTYRLNKQTFQRWKRAWGKDKKSVLCYPLGGRLPFFLVKVLFLFTFLGVTGHKDRSQIKVCSLYQKFWAEKDRWLYETFGTKGRSSLKNQLEMKRKACPPLVLSLAQEELDLRPLVSTILSLKHETNIKGVLVWDVGEA